MSDGDIVRRWRGTARVFGVSQASFNLGLMLVTTAAVLAGLASAGKLGGGWPIIVALVLADYVVLTSVVNRTVISVRDGAVHVEHGPLPWQRDRTVPTDQIAQLVVRTITQARVFAILRSGKDAVLLSYDKSSLLGNDEAEQIAARLRSKLGLRDAA